MTTRKPIYNNAGTLKEFGTTDVIDPASLGSGTRDGTKLLRDDGTWQSISYQAPLVSGTNIMTINGVSILSAGDLQVGGGIGASTTLFLNQTAAFEDNYSLTNTPTGLPESLTSVVCNTGTNAGVTFIERYVSPPLEGTSIEGGIWRFNTYAAVSSNTGLSEIIIRANRRREVTGVIVTMTGSGPTRTLTATTGTPFLPEHATASPLTAALLEIPGQTMWVSGYTSATQVTVTLTDSAFANVTGAALSAIYTLLFSVSTGDIASSTASLYKTETTQPPFSIVPTDRLILAYFGKTDSGSNRTISLYRDGSTHYSNTETPIAQRHNQLGGLNEGQYLHATPAEKATWNAKQDTLVSGTNIMTINGNSLLGSGGLLVGTRVRYIQLVAVPTATALSNGTNIIGAVECPVEGTVTALRAKTTSGTCTVTFNKAGVSLGTVNATSSGATNSSPTNTAISALDALTFDIASASGSGLVLTLTVQES